MKLLYTKRSPFARKVRVVALEKSIKIDLLDEDLQNKSNVLKEANPIAKVPTLILDNGHSIYDSKVIVQYLEEYYPTPQLIPSGEKRYDALKLEAMADDLVVNAINAFMEKIRHPKDANAAFIGGQEDSIKAVFAYLDNNIAVLEDIHIGTLNVACAVGYVHFRLPHLKASGSLLNWFETISKRPSFAKTIPVV